MKDRTLIESVNVELGKANPSQEAECVATPRRKTGAIRFGLALLLILGVPVITSAQMMGGGAAGATGATSGGAVGPSSVGLDSGPGTGIEVEGRIYPAGAAAPAEAPLAITVKLGDTEHRLTLVTRPIADREVKPADRENESLGGNEREFYRVIAKKTIRIATDPVVRDQLARLDEQERPLEIRGWMSGSASPILTLDYVGAVADDSTKAASTAVVSHPDATTSQALTGRSRPSSNR